ncbi:MAG: carboxylating nicotinate-nucleotide diphosphorylase [Bacillota bacterium]|jgi:nicotinate-nucleotide pyrophosphorylase (carboxylating)|nr:carboxylating nicotinate-nucleotide diphosphorylase [Bacillota bacterium]HOC07086.1 carboxylating nicotinate-nucleotide diphosphorylase [Bacillota bacterium]HPZ22924.1 carboxylating nicotinate-nucleotide diphosphorylase [Bacillota bacterium]
MNDFLLDQRLRDFLNEDIGTGDVTSACFSNSPVRRGWFTARAPGIVAGIPFAQRIYALLGVQRWISLIDDGQAVVAGTRLAYVDGPGSILLQGERVALNLLQRLSGIATKTREMVDIVSAQGSTRITDTRKTTPGLRWFERYAVRAGGGFNHRWGLYDAVMLKDNHIKLAGGIGKAVAEVRKHIGHTVKIEVEVENFTQLQQALDAGVEIIMLDNMTPSQVAEAVKIVAGRAVTEASGSVDISNVAAYGATGVDYISIGALTHSAAALDIGFDLDQPKGSGEAFA